MFIFYHIVLTHRFIYLLKKEGNSNLYFYSKISEEKLVFEKNENHLYLRILNDKNTGSINNGKHVLTYKKNNFIRFDILDDILHQNISDNIIWKIECNFDFLYILKLTNDISELSDGITDVEFKWLLFSFQYLKVIENKNLSKFIRALYFNMLLNQNINNSKNENQNLKVVFSLYHSLEIYSVFKRKLIIEFLNALMIRHVFYDENLILCRNIKDTFDPSLLNEHIPYKSLLINDFKVFSILEKIITNRHIFNYFMFLLEQINIKAFILNCYQVSQTKSQNFDFFSNCKHLFKAITISNLTIATQYIFSQLNESIDGNLEIFTLRNSIVDGRYVDTFLKKHNLKGLKLDNVNMGADVSFLDAYMDSNQSLEYIDLRKVKFNFSWLINLTSSSNIQKCILFFDLSFSEQYFIRECAKLKDLHIDVLLYLQIRFYSYRISEEFCIFLKNFRSLQTLILLNYRSDKNTDLLLLNAIGTLKFLENLTVGNNFFSTKFYNYLFQIPRIETLIINNFFLHKKTLELKPFSDYKYLTRLNLNSVKISGLSLIEIFKCENLKVLSLEFCELKSIRNIKLLDFRSLSIKSLCLSGSNLKAFKNLDILASLEYLETLFVSGCKSYLCNLTKLSIGCNLRLKKLTYKWGNISYNDLNRIKYLEVLEKLDLTECKFTEGMKLYKLGNDCRFLHSLKHLNLWGVRIDLMIIDI
ncbi:hypothetical protein CWI38_0657p0030 [Hamiltosporidium tvaerminnensis]|uniref:Leucine-rich repeat-containing protein n=1 Tax=Hamiltosporidium tvaerminnensis TaxID=1176355 RepID=A0A4Q9LYB9_9MICR|nr:hypothetical protein CWI38_0657p0030 [Hamiltosporidium tvaerminnensis]